MEAVTVRRRCRNAVATHLRRIEQNRARRQQFTDLLEEAVVQIEREDRALWGDDEVDRWKAGGDYPPKAQPRPASENRWPFD